MTEKPRAADPVTTGSASGGSTPVNPAEGEAGQRIIVRDRRKIDPTGGKDAPASSTSDPAGGKSEPTTSGSEPAGGEDKSTTPAGGADRAAAEAKGEPAAQEEASNTAEAAEAAEDDVVDVTEPARAQTDEDVAAELPASPVLDELVEEAEVEVEVGEGRARVPKLDQPEGVDGPVVDAPAKAAEGPGPFSAELEAVRSELDERTRDLQRVSAEYANYRKRVDRDRGLVAEQATGTVLTALLPVLDDLDRAREHGDLVGPFGSVAEQLTGALTKFGLTAFGEKGDPFDPTRHEAVAHLTSAEVTEPTCVDVMRRGYLLGDRLLRAALVAVADPE